jgi:hypothetical protein
VAQGNTVLVIEHNLDIIKNSDWIVDMGPEGGEAGGRIIAQGTVAQVARSPGSYTGEWLRKLEEIEKALPHARVPRSKRTAGSGTAAVGKSRDVVDVASPEAGEIPAPAPFGAPNLPEVFRHKPEAEDPVRKRGRPKKTIRV